MLNITEKSEGEAAKDYVLRQLIYNIVHTNLLPGQKLEAPELCSLMHVSNNPLREAELELAQSKLIEIKPKQLWLLSNEIIPVLSWLVGLFIFSTYLTRLYVSLPLYTW